MLASNINDICTSLAFARASVQIFSSLLTFFTSVKGLVVASIAMSDSSDSNLPKEPGNKVCEGAIGNAFLRKEKFRA